LKSPTVPWHLDFRRACLHLIEVLKGCPCKRGAGFETETATLGTFSTAAATATATTTAAMAMVAIP
jgi:hypothetical protein